MLRRAVWLSLLAAALCAAATPDECFALRKHGRKAELQTCFESLLQSREPGVRAEGFWGLGNYAQALNQFDAAVSANPKNANYHVRLGMLFHERFNNGDAEKEFQAALELDEHNAKALYGLALLGADGFDNMAIEYAHKALDADGNLVEARELLANLALENSDPAKAAEHADEALKLSGEALDAMAVHAAIEVLADRSPATWLDRLHKVNPIYGEAESLIAHHLVLNRRYEEGIAYYRKAIALEPELWPARSELGINLMRLGKDQEARTQLDLCYDNGYRDSATTNSLRLLDSYKNFTFFETNNTILKLHKKEADILRPYFESEMKRALATYDKKYQMKLPAPVQVEVYPDHEDFAVRTMGMPGLGALGVTFGEVVAMDSPSGRKPGSFHWASTMWHELSHVYVLTATHHRVPRWFTEGLAVHEETAAAPDWGDRVTPDILIAMRDKKLLPVAELDRGFIRPSYPNQVLISYFQAGRICDYINERWGWDKLLEMIHDYGDLKTTPQVIQDRLGMSPEQFDKEFLAWLDKQLGPTVASFDDWRKKIKEMVDLSRAAKYADVIKMGDEVIRLYSDFVETPNAYDMLSDAYLKTNDKANGMRVLAAYAKVGGRDPATLKKLAQLQEEAGLKKEAADTLEKLNLIYPVNDEDLHRRLGELWFAQGNLPGALREFRAVIASHPTDKAASYYNLAKAYQANHQPDEAEEQLLLSLEAAPSYRPAQKMLLEIQDSKKAK